MQTIDDVWNKFATQDELAQVYRDWLFKTSPRGMSEYEGLKPEDVNSEMKKCKDRTDCPIKQVVELCMNYPEKPESSLSNRILQTLQVEEVE